MIIISLKNEYKQSYVITKYLVYSFKYFKDYTLSLLYDRQLLTYDLT